VIEIFGWHLPKPKITEWLTKSS